LTNTAEIYEPGTGTWRMTAHPMNVARSEHRATKLADGRVLITGGGNGLGTTATVEVFDPATETFTFTTPMGTPHHGHEAVLLPDGRVMVIAGRCTSCGSPFAIATTELFDPTTAAWTTTAPVPVIVTDHRVVVRSGRVLVFGGYDGYTGLTYASVYSYDPTANTWSSLTPMNTPRGQHGLALLTDGRIFITGGSPNATVPVASTEVYDPTAGVTGASSSGPQLNAARRFHQTIQFADGSVLVAGGNYGCVACVLDSGEFLGDIAGMWTNAGTMQVGRTGFASALLPNGRALLVGGVTPSQNITKTADLWGPAVRGSGTIHINTNLSSATFSISPPIPTAPTTGPFPITIPNAPIGTYTVTFNPIAGYAVKEPLPLTQTLTVGGNISFAGTYFGTISVTSMPLGAFFQLDGPERTFYSGTTPKTISLAPLGDYKITWGILLGGYTTPPTETKSLLLSPTVEFIGRYAFDLVVNPPTLAFTWIVRQPPPKPQTLQISSSTGGQLAFTATSRATSGGLWLHLGTPVPSATPALLSVVASPDVALFRDDLPPGLYNGSVTLYAPDAAMPTTIIPVTLNVQMPASIALTQGFAFPMLGQTQTYTAHMVGASKEPLTNQLVTINVTGANSYDKKASTDASGNATFSNVGINPGTDTAVVTAKLGGVDIISNTKAVIWKPWAFDLLSPDRPPKGLQDPTGYNLNTFALWSTVTDVAEGEWENSINGSGRFNNDECFTGTVSVLKTHSIIARDNIAFAALAQQIFEFPFNFVPTGSFAADFMLKTAAHFAAVAVTGGTNNYGQEFDVTVANKTLGYVLAKAIGKFAVVTGPLTEDKIRDALKDSNTTTITAKPYHVASSVGFPVTETPTIMYSPDTHYIVLNVVTTCQKPQDTRLTTLNYVFRYEVQRFGQSDISVGVLGKPEVFLINPDGTIVPGQE